MNESTSLDLVDTIHSAPLEELSEGDLWAQADLLRAYEAVLRQRMRAELARRSALVRAVGASRRCRWPRDG